MPHSPANYGIAADRLTFPVRSTILRHDPPGAHRPYRRGGSAREQLGKIGDAAFAAQWESEAREVGTRREEDTLFIATGLLLPVWRKFPAKMLSVVRIASADGRAIVGRVVDAGDLGAICEGLGIDGPKLTPQAIVAAANGGARVPVNGLDALVLKTSRVAGSQRLELVGAPAERLSWYKQHGCFTEIIAYKTRLFIPDAKAEIILEAICTASQSELAEVA